MQGRSLLLFTWTIGTILIIGGYAYGRLPADDEMIAGQPALAVFEWGGFLSKSVDVVYGESDCFGDTKISPAPAWAASSLGEQILACPSNLRSMGGHFHVVHFTC